MSRSVILLITCLAVIAMLLGGGCDVTPADSRPPPQRSIYGMGLLHETSVEGVWETNTSRYSGRRAYFPRIDGRTTIILVGPHGQSKNITLAELRRLAQEYDCWHANREVAVSARILGDCCAKPSRTIEIVIVPMPLGE